MGALNVPDVKMLDRGTFFAPKAAAEPSELGRRRAHAKLKVAIEVSGEVRERAGVRRDLAKARRLQRRHNSTRAIEDAHLVVRVHLERGDGAPTHDGVVGVRPLERRGASAV